MGSAQDVQSRIKDLVEGEKFLLFMKGSRGFPQCGFSAQVVQILDEYLPEYRTVNVLEDPEVRQGIKDYSDWPTIPQLYVDGEFIGGCDIVRDMHTSGELEKVLGTAPIEVDPPEVTITHAAIKAFEGAAGDAEYEHLRFEIGPRFQYALSFGPALDGDVVVESNGMKLYMDRGTARKAGGTVIDFVDGPQGAGFKIKNPHEPPRVEQLTVKELKEKLDAGHDVTVFDVRPEQERDIAKLDFAVPLDSEDGRRQLDALPNDSFIVLQCRSGGRSQMAAQQVLAAGYTNVHNLVGGILAWADEIDPSLTKY
jgi:monothiol glutaredoxin